MVNDGKFHFYYERYMNHLDSLKMAEEQLRAARAKSVAIEEAAGGAFVGEFVVSAVQLLIRCRQVLCWTYVFGHYIKDPAVRKLFEFAQGQLESYTERFSAMTEQNTEAMFAGRDAITRWTQTLKQYLGNMEDYEAIAEAMVAVAAAEEAKAPNRKGPRPKVDAAAPAAAATTDGPAAVEDDGPPVPVWEYKRGGVWVQHDGVTVGRILEAMRSGKAEVEVTVARVKFIVQLNRMRQRNTVTNVEEQVRMVEVPAGAKADKVKGGKKRGRR